MNQMSPANAGVTVKPDSRINQFMAMSPAAIACLSLDGQVQELNPTFSRLFGYDKTDIPHIDMWWERAFPDNAYREDRRKQWEVEVAEALHQATMLHNFEALVHCKDGTQLWVEAHASFSDQEIFVMLLDISRRKQAEADAIKFEKQAENQRREAAWLNLALTASRAGTWEWQPDTDQQYWSSAIWDLFGLDSEHYQPSFEIWLNIIHPEDRSKLVVAIQHAVKNRTDFMQEYRVMIAGEARWLYVHGVAIDSPDQPLRYLGIITDITHHKQAQIALKEREEVMSAIVAQAGDAIELTDMQTFRFIEFNDSACSLLGYTREEYANLTVFDIQAETIDKDIRSRLVNVAVGQQLRFETKYRRKDCKVLDVQVSMRFIELHGHPYCVSIWGDITERKFLETKIRDLETRYRTIVDQAAPDAMYVHDFQGRFVEVNRRACENVGYTRQELLGMGVLDLDKDLDLANAQAVWERIPARGTHIFNSQHYRKDGSSFPVEIHCGMLEFDEQPLYVALVRDVTAAKAAEAALKASEKRFQDIVGVSADWIWEVDVDGRFTYVSNSIELLLGYRVAEVLGRTPFEFMPADEAAKISEKFNALMQQRASFRDLVNINIHKDGTLRYVQTSGTPIFADSGEFIGYRGLDRDITELKHADEQMSILSEAIKQSPNSVVVTDPNMQITYVNDAFTRITGYAYSEVIGQSANLLSGDTTPPETLNDLYAAVAAGNSWQGEIHNRRRDGRIGIDFCHVAPVHDSGGRLTHFVSVQQDITLRKTMENQLAMAEKRWSFALENSLQGVYDWNIPQDTVYYSPMWKRLLGIEDMAFDNSVEVWASRVHPEDRAILHSSLRLHLLNDQQSFSLEYRLRHADGQYLWFFDCGKIVEYSDAGMPLRMIGTITDITEQKRVNEQLVRYADMVKSAATPLIMLDRDLRFVVDNPAHHALIKLAEHQVIGHSIAEIVGANYAEIEPKLLACLQGEPQHYQVCHDLPGEERVILDVKLYPHEVGGQIMGVVAALNDITELVSARESLLLHQQQLERLVIERTTEARAAEEQLRLILESSADGIFGANLQGQITFVNPATEKLLGYSASYLLGRPMHATFHHHHADGNVHSEAECPIKACLNDHNLVRVNDDVFWRADGIALPVSYAARPMYRDGEIIGLVVSFSDITERKKADAALRESEARFRHLAEAAPVLIWMSGLDKLCHYFNRGWLEFTGRTLEQEYGDGWVEDIYPDDKQYCLEKYTTAFEARQSFSMEYRLRRFDGEYRWLLDNGVPRWDDKANFLGYIGCCSDITDIKLAMEERERAQQAAEHVAQIKSEFLANMSHEIRTPLNGMLGFAQIGYRESAGRDQSQKIFSRILESGKLLLSIINDILDFSKIEVGKLMIETEPYAPADLIENILTVFSQPAKSKGLAMHARLHPELPKACLGDPTRLSQILLNLVSNALKFTEHGMINLEAKIEGENLVFTVSDTGIGMTYEQISRLFTPFEQADASTTRKFGGTGLGLSISQRLAGLMGGEIQVESTPDIGSCFILTIPYVATDLSAAPVPLASYNLPLGQRLQGIRILAAEDNEVNQLVLQDMLTSEGARLKLVSNGRLAVEAVQKAPNEFDIIVMDVQMPEMDGREAARQIQAIAPGLAIIGQTAHAMIEERNLNLAAGMVDTITKPLIHEDLVSIILRYVGSIPKASNMELIDWDELSKRFNQRNDFIEKLLNTAIKSLDMLPAQLLEAAKHQDMQSMAFIGHSLKGTAGNFGANQLQELARQLQDSSRANEPESVKLAEQCAALLENVLIQIREKVQNIQAGG